MIRYRMTLNDKFFFFEIFFFQNDLTGMTTICLSLFIFSLQRLNQHHHDVDLDGPNWGEMLSFKGLSWTIESINGAWQSIIKIQPIWTFFLKKNLKLAAKLTFKDVLNSLSIWYLGSAKMYWSDNLDSIAKWYTYYWRRMMMVIYGNIVIQYESNLVCQSSLYPPLPFSTLLYVSLCPLDTSVRLS